MVYIVIRVGKEKKKKGHGEDKRGGEMSELSQQVGGRGGFRERVA